VECKWNFKFGQGHPHPQDSVLISELCPHSVAAECVGVEGEYVVLTLLGKTIRVRPFSIRIRPKSPAFRHGDVVRTLLGPGVKTEVIAPVLSPEWHVRNNEWAYFLDHNGRRRNHRYREGELELVRRRKG
jgi:hypothetical protein